jgi:hypothetical protein
MARADYDRRDIIVAGAPHEQVDEVVAVNEYFLEVMPAFRGTSDLIPQCLNLRHILPLEQISGSCRNYVQDLTRMIIDRIN